MEEMGKKIEVKEEEVIRSGIKVRLKKAKLNEGEVCLTYLRSSSLETGYFVVSDSPNVPTDMDMLEGCGEYGEMFPVSMTIEELGQVAEAMNSLYEHVKTMKSVENGV